MKQQRNLDLIRDLLLALEGIEDVDLSGYTSEQIDYHIFLLTDAGLAEGNAIWDVPRKAKGPAKIVDLPIIQAELWYITAYGQDLLADARSPRVWKDVTGNIASKGLDVSLSVLKTVLAAKVTQLLVPGP